jgi:hypothetical protein
MDENTVALLLLLAFIAGFIVAVLLTYPALRKLGVAIDEADEETAQLKDELYHLKRRFGDSRAERAVF